ncbi:hypothetical protein OCEANICA350_40003 [Oceanicaulis sp. 350]|nr:hypothetical protein OCEANICA350_40003 [Oceanicaulis sp. 350]
MSIDRHWNSSSVFAHTIEGLLLGQCSQVVGHPSLKSPRLRFLLTEHRSWLTQTIGL